MGEACGKNGRKRKTEEAVVEGRMDVEESEAKAVGVRFFFRTCAG